MNAANASFQTSGTLHTEADQTIEDVPYRYVPHRFARFPVKTMIQANLGLRNLSFILLIRIIFDLRKRFVYWRENLVFLLKGITFVNYFSTCCYFLLLGYLNFRRRESCLCKGLSLIFLANFAVAMLCDVITPSLFRSLV